MTETKAAEPTTACQHLWIGRDRENVWFCTDCRTPFAPADRLLSLSREVEAKDAEIAKLTTERDDARREADRAQARAARIAEMDPEGEMADDDMQEALREIESLQVQNVRRENEIAALASRCEALTELVRDYDDFSKHDEDCNVNYGGPQHCACGVIELRERARSLLSTASDEGKAG